MKAHGEDGPVRIGLTGPIGCGKSTVAGYLADLGAVVVDADRLARAVTEPGEPAVAAIAERFGADLVDADGRLDRSALGRIVFADPAALADLEAIVHPAVWPRILAALDAAATSDAPAVVLEAIRLVDGGYVDLVDEVWLVACSPDAQRARLARRGLDDDEIAKRTTAQLELVERARNAATRIIATDGSIDEMRAAVNAALVAAATTPEWPFDQSPDAAAVVTRAVLKGSPILFVSHDQDDHGWQFLDGRTPVESEGQIIGMGTALARDASLRAIADLPPGWVAWRTSSTAPWRRQRTSSGPAEPE